MNAILRRLDLPIVDFQTCQNSLRQTRLGCKFNLHNSFICASGQAGKDTCNEDEGSPLVCPMQTDPDRYYQAGMVSTGVNCGPSAPGIYANVAKARDWIESELNINGLENSCYSTDNSST